MTQRADTDNYRELFLADVPMMDMRAPTEFSRGAFPSATSLPLMSDDERAAVGTCYKKEGQAAAIALGHQIVSGELKEQRLAAWQEFAKDNPAGYLYCFRGGLRSQTVQAWLREAGVDYPLIKGGYKAMRRFLIEEFERNLKAAEIVLIGGKTGTGKTRVVSVVPGSIDLEGLAVHRGSTFGQLLEPQPAQIDFENTLSIALMKRLAEGSDRIYLEDEGRLIGRISLPPVLIERMKQAPLVLVEESVASRVQVVLEDYVLDLGERFEKRHGEDGPAMHREKLLGDLAKITKRLGGERQQAVAAMIEQAFEEQQSSGDLELHRRWIETLLCSYYDPMYEYQLSRRAGEVLFRGTRSEVIAWAQQ